MQIVIPMSGVGQRFINQGYTDPKPLIEVDGKRIIEHVVDLFPGEENFVFICNETHLRETAMREVLLKAAPRGTVVGIPPHKKGPVYAVSKIFDRLPEDEEVIVNYCDFFTYWDYGDFLRSVRDRNADGAIPAYRGFHPHMRGTTNYAFMREEDRWMLEIKEKEPFTENRLEEFASNGTYYFKSGALVKKYFREYLAAGQALNGEYYVSLVYNLLRNAGLGVAIYEIQHMFQWGTPEDLREYQGWSDYFRRLVGQEFSPGKRSFCDLGLVPLAGRGLRFSREGYDLPKPLIPVGGKPMVVQATRALPKCGQYHFICLGEHLDRHPLAEELGKAFPGCAIARVEGVTQGQACTAERGLEGARDDMSLLIGACDNGMLFDPAVLADLIADQKVDAVVFSSGRHASALVHPEIYGWLEVDPDRTVRGVSVKHPVSDCPEQDQIIVGSFYFRSVGLFRAILNRLYEEDIRVNGEFYIDSMVGLLVRLGYRVKAFEVEHYICWGTPDDLRTYEYWQSCFHKWDHHPYALERDPTIDPAASKALDRKFREFSGNP